MIYLLRDVSPRGVFFGLYNFKTANNYNLYLIVSFTFENGLSPCPLRLFLFSLLKWKSYVHLVRCLTNCELDVHLGWFSPYISLFILANYLSWFPLSQKKWKPHFWTLGEKINSCITFHFLFRISQIHLYVLGHWM